MSANAAVSDESFWLVQEEVGMIEGQVGQLRALVQQQDALNASLQQRLNTAAEAESRAQVLCYSFLVTRMQPS